MENEETSEMFKKEVKYIFELIIFLRDRTDEPRLPEENLKKMAKTFMVHLIKMTKDSMIASKLTYQIMMEKPTSL